jgi:hypothetical protein
MPAIKTHSCSYFITNPSLFWIPRYSFALEIQWPLLALCCKMNSTFKLQDVIIALLYARAPPYLSLK